MRAVAIESTSEEGKTDRSAAWRWMGPVGRRADFRRLWAAATGSALGTYITGIAMALLAVDVLDASAWQISALGLAGTAPSFIIGLVAGAWVDRLRRRPVMIACDLVRAAVLTVIPAAAWLGWLTMNGLIAAMAIHAVASLFFDLADRSMLPALVPREELVDANRLVNAGMTVSEAGGFAVGGWLVHVISAPGALLFDAASYLWSALLLKSIRTPEPPPGLGETREPIVDEIRAGLAYVWAKPMLRVLAATLFIASTGRQMIGVVIMIYVSRDLGFSAGALGLIFATGGIFSLLGSIASGRVVARLGVGPMLLAALAFKFLADGAITLTPSPTLIGGALLIAGQVGDFGSTLYHLGEVSLRQTVTEDAWQGRMHGTFRVLEFGGYLAGALLGGALGEAIGARGTILVAALVVLAATGPILLSPVRSLRAMPAQAL
jgi:MFS family permease